MLIDIFQDPVWQMSLGERAAVEGVLSRLQPSLAIELGTAEGASLARIAAHSREVHSFDLTPPSLPVPDNAVLHTGDSHELLPALLAELAAAGRNVDFALVDGDHSPEGVRQDIEDLLDSPALSRTVILIHDLTNERVRAGVDAVRFEAWPKVAHVELDWVPGQLFAEPALRHELWAGLGLVIVDAARTTSLNGNIYERRYFPSAHLLAQIRDVVVARERAPEGTQALEDEALVLRLRVDELEQTLAEAGRRIALLDGDRTLREARLAGAERALTDIKGSLSWRITEPLRVAKRRTRGRH